MFPNAVMKIPQTWQRHSGHHDRRARCARLGLAGTSTCSDVTYEEAEHRACRVWFHGPHAFECIPQRQQFLRPRRIEPVLKAVCARNAEQAQAFAETVGL